MLFSMAFIFRSHHFQNNISRSAAKFFGHEVGPKSLQRLSVDNTFRQKGGLAMALVKMIDNTIKCSFVNRLQANTY